MLSGLDITPLKLAEEQQENWLKELEQSQESLRDVDQMRRAHSGTRGVSAGHVPRFAGEFRRYSGGRNAHEHDGHRRGTGADADDAEP